MLSELTSNESYYIVHVVKVPAAIAQCQRAGIVVRLVTGDALSTAKFVAYKCGILQPTRHTTTTLGDSAADDDDDGDLALEGRQFNKMIRPQPEQPVCYYLRPRYHTDNYQEHFLMLILE